MVDRVGETTSQWLPVPAKFEAGSPNLAGALGFAAAVGFVQEHCTDAAGAHVRALRERALAGLEASSNVRIYGPRESCETAGIVSFNINGIHPHDVAQIAAERNVAVRAGHHCCQPLMARLGQPATVRASFAPYNQVGDIDALLDSVDAARQFFG